MIFVCLAAYFVSENRASLGAFVAVGIYKDLLANALKSVFQITNQHSLLGPQRELLDDLEPDDDSQVKGVQGVAILDGEICVRNVRFRYGTLDEEVLRSVSMSVARGEVVALSGPSGSGKSTLLKLVVGWHEPTYDEITIGQMPAHCGLRGIASILQSARLMSTSIRRNLEFFRGRRNDEELMGLLKI